MGVDIFFVISGYLITGNLLRATADWKTALAEFYSRRIRRIFPAVIVTYIIISVAATLILFPLEFSNVSASIVSSIFFVSNIYFYTQSDYFESGLATDPLLHTWSLSVEEQFYLLFPFLIFLTRGAAARYRAPLILGLALASFVGSVLVIAYDRSAAFYLVPFRAWEFMLGATLAVGLLQASSRPWVAEAEGLAGLALIAGSVLLIDSTMPFPGFAALPPCVGAALIIKSGLGRQTATRRLLSLFPFRFIGQISYSWYLWHWPIIIFYWTFDNAPSVAARAALLLFSLVAATLSWRFVELPFRRDIWGTPPRIIRGGAFAITLTGATVVGAAMSNAALRPEPPNVARVLGFLRDDSHAAAMRKGLCFVEGGGRNGAYRADICLARAFRRPNVLLIGDSDAAHLYPGLAARYPHINFLQATVSGCKPFIDVESSSYCGRLMRATLRDFVPAARLDAVIVSARWRPRDRDPLLATVAHLKKFTRHVIVSGPMIEYDMELPRILALNLARGEPIETRRVEVIEQADAILTRALRNTRIIYFSPYRALCAAECRAWAAPEVPMQFDYGHLTTAGSLLVAEALRPQLEQILPKP